MNSLEILSYKKLVQSIFTFKDPLINLIKDHYLFEAISYDDLLAEISKVTEIEEREYIHRFYYRDCACYISPERFQISIRNEKYFYRYRFLNRKLTFYFEFMSAIKFLKLLKDIDFEPYHQFFKNSDEIILNFSINTLGTFKIFTNKYLYSNKYLGNKYVYSNNYLGFDDSEILSIKHGNKNVILLDKQRFIVLYIVPFLNSFLTNRREIIEDFIYFNSEVSKILK